MRYKEFASIVVKSSQHEPRKPDSVHISAIAERYKVSLKSLKVEVSNKETQRIKAKPIEELKAKEFLTVRDVATLLNCSVRSVYYYIKSGNIKAVNLSKRATRVKRSEIDKQSVKYFL